MTTPPKPAPGRRRRRWAVLTLASALAGAGLLVAGAPPEAAAHTALVASTPSADSRGTAPDAIQLTFSDTIEPAFTTVTLAVDGSPPVTLPSQITRTEVRATPPGPAAEVASAQQWKISYRVVSQDGHPIIGSITFTVDPPPATRPAGSTAGALRPSTSAGNSPTPASPLTSAAPAPSQPTVAATPTVRPGFPPANDSHPRPGLPFVVVMAALLLVGPVVAGLLVLLPKRLPREEEEPAPTDHTAGLDSQNGQSQSSRPPVNGVSGQIPSPPVIPGIVDRTGPPPASGTAPEGEDGDVVQSK